jgi:2-polyprenyl-3-methyl-5-hydroxy-6-metoxy-1,4-benzoquinol methylase
VRRIFQLENHWIKECNHCTHRFVDVKVTSEHTKQVYGDDYFRGGKAGYPSYLSQGKLLIERGRYYGNLLRKYMSPGQMLDVGAASGFILKGLIDCGWQGVGVEPNARMAAYGREKLGLTIINGAFEDFQCDQQFNLITMIQVLPHLYNLNRAFEKLAEMTRPGGYWLIETWNKDSFTARIMGKAWHEYSPPSVLHWFSPKTLRHFIHPLGFRFIALGRPIKKISGAHVKSLLRYKLSARQKIKRIVPLLQVIPDNAKLPYLGDDIFWILFQKK